MEISQSQREAYSEIDEFLELITEEEKNQIPQKLRDFFKREKANGYHKGINLNVPIKDQNLKSETLALIALLNLQYWCKDEEEKERLKKIYADNEKKYQDKMREKYNPDNIFKNNKTEVENIKKDNAEDSNQLIEYKESIFKKIFTKLLRIFHIK